MFTSSDNSTATQASEADTLRKQGIFSGAIERFNDILREDSRNAWAYAHRGAAKSSILELEGAVQDLDRAIAIRKEEGREYPWAHAHKGEAYRVYARYHMWRSGRARQLEDLLKRSDESFEAALAGRADYPWASAHHAATCTYRYAIGRHIHRLDEKDYEPFAELAVQRFDQALHSDPSYSWAFAFKAFLSMMRDDASRAVPDRALAGMDERLLVLEPLSALRNYEHRYEDAARAGWLQLQEDPHAVIASYFAASSLSALEKEGRGPGQKTVDAAIGQAHALLRHREILTGTLRAALEYQRDGDIGPIREALRKLKAEPDLETYFLVNLDSSLEGLRKEHPDWFKPQST